MMLTVVPMIGSRRAEVKVNVDVRGRYYYRLLYDQLQLHIN